MMKTLLINAHPDFRNDQHFSNQLKKRFIEMYRNKFGIEDLTQLNLYEDAIPRIEVGQLWSIWQKQANQGRLNDNESLINTQANHLLRQFMTHHRVIIVSPLHNFNVPSRLKDYIDNILIARKTFRYLDFPRADGKSSTGLLTDDYRVLYIQASGSVYSGDNFYKQLDFATNYLQAIFQEVMGFSQFEIVRAEGTATVGNEQVIAQSTKQLTEAFKKLYFDDI